MKKALLFLIIFLLLFPAVAQAYDIDGSYKSNKEPVLNGVDCIGVDSQENIYLKDIGFKATILVYSNIGEFLHSIKVPTNGSYYFKVDDYIWVLLLRGYVLLKYSLDGDLLEEKKVNGREFLQTIEDRSVTKNGITYRIKGALGLFSVWKEEDGINKKMFNLPIKHFLLNLLFIVGFIAFSIYAGISAHRFWYGDKRPDDRSNDDRSNDDRSDDKRPDDEKFTHGTENYWQGQSH